MKKLYLVAILYLYIPLLLFVVCWTNILVAIITTVVSSIALYCGYKKMTVAEETANFITWKEMVFFGLVIFAFCIFCGGGDLFVQDLDWDKHHAILYDLVNREWPVTYSGDVLLTYYLGQYLVPGFIGKVFGHSCMVAVWAQTVWNALGILIAFVFACKYVKADSFVKRFVALTIIILWGGATNLGSWIYQLWGNDVGLCSYKWIDIERIRVHFASNLDAVRGAYQHVIVPWVSCSMLMLQKKKVSCYLLLGLPLMFSSTFGFIYLAVILFLLFVVEIVKNKKRIIAIKEVCSFSNLALIPLASLMLVYLSGNIFGYKPEGNGWSFINMFANMDFYLLFIMVEFMGYAIFLWKRNKGNELFCIAIFELLIIPFISLGVWNDLCSRGSVPARFILMLFCMEQVFLFGKKEWRNLGIAIIFFFSALNSIHEAGAAFHYTIVEGLGSETILSKNIQTFDGWAANDDVRIDMAYNYFTLDYSQSMFYKIARK